jgi:large subunit ribosomal protein L35
MNAKSAEFCVKERSSIVPRKTTTKKYKIKTHKATSKRFRMTGSGMLVRTKGGKSHLRRRTSKRTKRLLDEMIPVKGRGIVKSVNRLAPYMKKAS